MSVLHNFARLFAEESPKLRRFLERFGSSVSADDIAQDSFAALCAEDAQRIEAPRAYLFKIARNLAINARKRANLVRFETGRDASIADIAADAPGPEDDVVVGDLVERLYIALHKLPDNKRDALILFKLEGHSYKEIGQRLGVSPRTVERYVADALTHLHHELRHLHEG
ncbi:MAG: RNA polymerase sigma factor [Terricaulis sp.]